MWKCNCVVVAGFFVWFQFLITQIIEAHLTKRETAELLRSSFPSIYFLRYFLVSCLIN